MAALQKNKWNSQCISKKFKNKQRNNCTKKLVKTVTHKRNRILNKLLCNEDDGFCPKATKTKPFHYSESSVAHSPSYSHHYDHINTHFPTDCKNQCPLSKHYRNLMDNLKYSGYNVLKITAESQVTIAGWNCIKYHRQCRTWHTKIDYWRINIKVYPNNMKIWDIDKNSIFKQTFNYGNYTFLYECFADLGTHRIGWQTTMIPLKEPYCMRFRRRIYAKQNNFEMETVKLIKKHIELLITTKYEDIMNHSNELYNKQQIEPIEEPIRVDQICKYPQNIKINLMVDLKNRLKCVDMEFLNHNFSLKCNTKKKKINNDIVLYQYAQKCFEIVLEKCNNAPFIQDESFNVTWKIDGVNTFSIKDILIEFIGSSDVIDNILIPYIGYKSCRMYHIHGVFISNLEKLANWRYNILWKDVVSNFEKNQYDLTQNPEFGTKYYVESSKITTFIPAYGDNK